MRARTRLAPRLRRPSRSRSLLTGLEQKYSSFSISKPCSRQSATTSRSVQQRMFGVSNHSYGRRFDFGMRPVARRLRKTRQWPKFGNEITADGAMRSISRSVWSGRRITCSVSLRRMQS